MMRKGAMVLAILLLCACREDDHELRRVEATMLTFESPAFADGGALPPKYTCDGAGISPPLKITQVPASAKSLALIVTDPDAPGGTFTHWVIWNMKVDRRVIDEGRKPDGSEEGRNDFGKDGWGAPCPPSGEHRYVFHLYALDDRLSAGPTRESLEKAMDNRVISEATVTAKYRRR